MKLKYLLVFLVIFSACKTKTEQKLSENILAKNQIFELNNTIGLSDSIREPTNLILTKKNEFIIGSYEEGKVTLLDSNGLFKKNIISKILYPKKLRKFGNPLAIAENPSGFLFVSDNKNRRIYEFDKNFDFKASFLIAGHHISPVSMAVTESSIYMGGYDQDKGTYIHQYDYAGSPVRNFRKSDIRLEKDGVVTSVLNYPFLTVQGNKIFSVELLKYNINSNDIKGTEIFNYDYSSSHYPLEISEVFSKHKGKSFSELWDFCNKQINILSNKNHLFVVHEMPKVSKLADYYLSRQYYLDILNLDGMAVDVNIDFKNERPFFATDNFIYTLSKVPDSNFQIKKYSIKLKA